MMTASYAPTAPRFRVDIANDPDTIGGTRQFFHMYTLPTAARNGFNREIGDMIGDGWVLSTRTDTAALLYRGPAIAYLTLLFCDPA